MSTIELETETSPEDSIAHPTGVTVNRDGTPREGVKEEVVIKILSLIKKNIYIYSKCLPTLLFCTNLCLVSQFCTDFYNLETKI